MTQYRLMMPAHHQTDLRLTLSHRIRDSLVRQIVSGERKPGERLVETRVAAAFGTSQAPVREALRELEIFGLVEIKPRRGTFVRSFIRETLRESYVVRAALEETATRLVLMAGNVPFDELGATVERMRLSAHANDPDAVGLESVMFHRHIIMASGNDLIKRTWENLHIEARTSVTIAASTLNLIAIADDHDEILQSLTLDDIEAACALARKHQWDYGTLSDVGSSAQEGSERTEQHG